jgi:peptidyl-prolyl cis-trans isomerase SurA
MGKIINTLTLKTFLFLAGFLGIHDQAYASDLIELNRVVAKVNERIVTWGEIEKAMTLLNFTDQEKKDRANEFVDGKVDRLLSITAFREKGMNIPDSYIEQEYNKRLIKDFNNDRKLFRDTLRSKGLSQLEYRKEIEEEIIYGHMLSTRRRLKEEISPEKVESYYETNSDKFKTLRKVQLGEIAFSQIAGEPETVLLQQAHKVLNEIKAGQTFEEAALKNGQSPFREKSGDWGVMISEKEIRSEEIRKVAFSLKEGGVSKPFIVNILERKPDGTVGGSGKIAVYILKALKVTKAGRKPLDEVRNQIERTLASDIEAQSHRQWLSRLKRDAYVRVTLPQ